MKLILYGFTPNPSVKTKMGNPRRFEGFRHPTQESSPILLRTGIEKFTMMKRRKTIKTMRFMYTILKHRVHKEYEIK